MSLVLSPLCDDFGNFCDRLSIMTFQLLLGRSLSFVCCFNLLHGTFLKPLPLHLLFLIRTSTVE